MSIPSTLAIVLSAGASIISSAGIEVLSEDVESVLELPHETKEIMSKKICLEEYVAGLSNEEKAKLFKEIASTPDDATVSAQVELQMASLTREYIETIMLDSFAAESGMDKETIRN